jgi:hypothetical protein
LQGADIPFGDGLTSIATFARELIFLLEIEIVVRYHPRCDIASIDPVLANIASQARL